MDHIRPHDMLILGQVVVLVVEVMALAAPLEQCFHWKDQVAVAVERK